MGLEKCLHFKLIRVKKFNGKKSSSDVYKTLQDQTWKVSIKDHNNKSTIADKSSNLRRM